MAVTKKFSVVEVFTYQVIFESNYYLECLAFQEINDNSEMPRTLIYDNELGKEEKPYA